MNNLLEVKTYKQPSGIIIQLQRLDNGFARLVNEQFQQWGTTEKTSTIPKSYMMSWQNFEEKIGSQLL